MREYEELFKFAAKTGSLEGYLFEREDIEPLDNWVGNIERMYASLPDNIKEDIKTEFSGVLTKTLNYGEKVLGEEIRMRLNHLLSAL